MSKTSSSSNRSNARTEYEINMSDGDVEFEQPLGKDKSKKRVQKSHIMGWEHTPRFNHINEQIILFNGIQQERNAHVEKFL
ncbi:hypothetical protein Hanom_Chr07g00642351 [Helianthus anomalus]